MAKGAIGRIFIYHGMAARAPRPGSSREKKYCVKTEQFRAQLRQIAEEGFRVATLGEFWGGKVRGAKPPVVLTIDGGRASDYEIAYPTLVEAGSKATFFVNTGKIGTAGFLSWGQIAEMYRGGMSFQSYGHDHVYLTRLSLGELERQLTGSRRMLEDRLQTRVEFLGVPYGDMNGRVLDRALGAGYQAVCNADCLPAVAGATTINRVVVYEGTNSQDFHRLLEGDQLSYGLRRARGMLLYGPKRVALGLKPKDGGMEVLESRTR